MTDETPAAPTEPSRSRTVPPVVLAAALAAVLVLVVLGAYVLGAVNHRPDPSSPQGVRVSGKGTVTATPDQLTFDVTVEHRAADVATAMNASNADTRKVLAVLAAQGIAEADIATQEVAVEPRYDYKAPDGEKITGYSATQRMSVKVRRLDSAGAVISAAAGAAGNAARIGNVAMSVADKSDLQSQARARAVRDARRKAQQYAAAAGRDLGSVVVIEEESASAPPVAAAADLASATSGVAETPISAGSQRISVQVTVRFSLD